MLYLLITSCIIIILYCSIFLLLRKAWNYLPAFSTTNNTEIFISIIIPVRNEEKNLPSLFSLIKSQEYPNNKFEVIIVDDHSEDATYAWLSSDKNRETHIKLIQLNESLFGKKAALKQGILQAKGEVIVTLDADCRFGSQWLQCIASYYAEHKPDLLICPILIEHDSTFIGAFQSLEMISLTATAAATAFINRATMCNGANLVFKRDVYLSLTDPAFSTIPSGDDIFLLLSLKKTGKYKIDYLKSLQAIAYTSPTSSWKTFFSQSRRWAGKSPHYRDVDIILLAVVVLMANCILPVWLIYGIFHWHSLAVFLLLLVLKAIFDFIFLYPAVTFFNKSKLWRSFIACALLYPLYTLAIAISILVKPAGNWKNRKI